MIFINLLIKNTRYECQVFKKSNYYVISYAGNVLTAYQDDMMDIVNDTIKKNTTELSNVITKYTDENQKLLRLINDPTE